MVQNTKEWLKAATLEALKDSKALFYAFFETLYEKAKQMRETPKNDMGQNFSISLEEQRKSGSRFGDIANLVFNQFIRESPRKGRRRGSSL